VPLRLISVWILLSGAAHAVPLSDNVLFAFEKCKSLSIDLEKGLLKESPSQAFDLHCQKMPEKATDLKCAFFDQGSTKKLSEEIFTGGSELGEAELKDKNQRRIRFLIGKSFASFESGSELKACAGIYIFEKEALKKKTSP
jgi:hypothetical protein